MTLKNKKVNGCIWLKENENKYTGVLLNNFPELYYAGYILLTEYNNINSVKQLISLGDLFELKELPSTKILSQQKYVSISTQQKYDAPFHQFSSNSEIGTKRASYSYLFKNNQWYYNLLENYQLLTHEIIEDSIENPIQFYDFFPPH